MGENSLIAWTDHTFNPWVGCTKVSAGCTNCYAEALDRRVGGGLVDGTKRLRWGKGAPRTRTKTWGDPIRWNARAAAAGKREKVFCASLADVFDAEVPRGWLQDLFALIKSTPNLDWLLLTKRPENFDRLDGGWDPETGGVLNVWPANVWLGCTVETQEQAERRIPLLLKQDAVVRFLSCEPLLGPLDLSRWTETDDEGRRFSDLDWCIIGGESGSKARPFDLSWARSLVAQCRAADVAPFVKQLGARPVESAAERLRHLRGADAARAVGSLPGAEREMLHVDIGLASPARHPYSDPSEWPEDLRVREWPEVRR